MTATLQPDDAQIVVQILQCRAALRFEVQPIPFAARHPVPEGGRAPGAAAGFGLPSGLRPAAERNCRDAWPCRCGSSPCGSRGIYLLSVFDAPLLRSLPFHSRNDSRLRKVKATKIKVGQCIGLDRNSLFILGRKVKLIHYPKRRMLVFVNPDPEVAGDPPATLAPYFDCAADPTLCALLRSRHFDAGRSLLLHRESCNILIQVELCFRQQTARSTEWSRMFLPRQRGGPPPRAARRYPRAHVAAHPHIADCEMRRDSNVQHARKLRQPREIARPIRSRPHGASHPVGIDIERRLILVVGAQLATRERNADAIALH